MVNILIFNSIGVLLEKSATPDTFYGKINNLINPFHMCQKKYQNNTKKRQELNIGKSNYALNYKRKNRCLWKHVKDKKVSRKSRHQFIKGRSLLTNLVAFYEETVCSEQRVSFALILARLLTQSPVTTSSLTAW